MKFYLSLIFCIGSILSYSYTHGQPITGFWKGKINGKKVEVKIIKNGDSLTGTSYYYESSGSYRRYSIKGYFDNTDNSVVWWDDELIEEKKGKNIFPPAAVPYFSNADFNCPGGNKMLLQGNAVSKDNQEKPQGPVDLQKTNSHIFDDEWDFIIDNYTVGANDPDIIDSVGKIAFTKPDQSEEEKIIYTKPEQPLPEPIAIQTPKDVVAPVEKKEERKPITEPVLVQAPKEIIPSPVKEEIISKPPLIEPLPEPIAEIKPLSIDEKFASREKVILKEIPVVADSIELSFYDNAEVDGDSISIFLNGHRLFEHVRLTEKAYTIKLAVADLQEANDLIMVAENLGSIPPNTSYMVFYVDGKRYDARIESTEQSSAGIRFIRKKT